ncbi:amino acid synthesis family protein [Burkholderia pseudomultivorans]|uniref:amino acid synthesis family protein n=1 Tax=Burkholderia pseudomultivorans TaxID=1207504 RepID=UPI0028749910|nr:amino acid synthesis family protein [Burkholderia pseudomultivorans]MDS0858620.1 amino acid synthesis family protein [Burkholderia pseudomultivorans]
MNSLITKIVVHLVERRAELHVPVDPPHRQVVAAAVLRFDGWVADGPVAAFEPLYELGAELGSLLTGRARWALDVAPSVIQAYGKAALVGTALPLECAAALLHPRMGKAMRASLPGATSLIPSVTKRAAPGACLDVPLHGSTDMWSFDHFDTVSLALADAPASNEIVVAVALADSGRPLARVRPD